MDVASNWKPWRMSIIDHWTGQWILEHKALSLCPLSTWMCDHKVQIHTHSNSATLQIHQIPSSWGLLPPILKFERFHVNGPMESLREVIIYSWPSHCSWVSPIQTSCLHLPIWQSLLTSNHSPLLQTSSSTFWVLEMSSDATTMVDTHLEDVVDSGMYNRPAYYYPECCSSGSTLRWLPNNI